MLARVNAGFVTLWIRSLSMARGLLRMDREKARGSLRWRVGLFFRRMKIARHLDAGWIGWLRRGLAIRADGFDFFAALAEAKKFRVRTMRFGDGAGPAGRLAGLSQPRMRFWFCARLRKILCRRLLLAV